MRWFSARWFGAVLVACGLLLPTAAGSEAVLPTVTGPIVATGIPGNPAHDYPFFASNHDLALRGYLEDEYLVNGTASRYETPPSGETGHVLDADHPYTTRIIVRRPADPHRFNGTVVVEWLNVTNGFDADNAWFFAWEHLLDSGYAWVGVSAQRVGVDRMKAWSPKRYGTLDVTQGGTITDDALSYDIYRQVGVVLRHRGASIDVLGGLRPQHIIATGESQSAFRLSTYVNSVDPLDREYDGFLLLSTLGMHIRTDIARPVFKISTEFDVQDAEAGARQPDSKLFRAWEMAGTSHVDYHLRLSREPLELRDLGTSSEATLAPTCGIPTIGTRVPAGDIMGAAYDELVRWVSGGAPPPSAPKIVVASMVAPHARPELGPTAPAASNAILKRNALGLSEGGIRLAAMDAPTGLSVGGNTGPGACNRWGSYTPLSVAQLAQLYPNHTAYVHRVAEIARANALKGYILNGAAQRTIAAANASMIGTRQALARR
jgi:hypothetical protein